MNLIIRLNATKYMSKFEEFLFWDHWRSKKYFSRFRFDSRLDVNKMTPHFISLREHFFELVLDIKQILKVSMHENYNICKDYILSLK